jgi:plastocyanin
VSRAACAVALCALVAVVTLVPAAAESLSAAGPARASAAECTWQRHAKRVFKRVKRHGKVRRVSSVKHAWSCDPVATPSPAPQPTPEPVAPAPTPAPNPEPAPTNRLGVKSAEYSYTLSRPSVSAGEVTIELSNFGEDAHNLNLQREGSEDPELQIPETPSQQHQTAHFTLTPGTYRLWCSLPTHDEKGMHATLVVSAG